MHHEQKARQQYPSRLLAHAPPAEFEQGPTISRLRPGQSSY